MLFQTERTWWRPKWMALSKKEMIGPNQYPISLLKKPLATNTSQWLRTNSSQVTVFLRSGAGRIP
jgi:hypothetical protein